MSDKTSKIIVMGGSFNPPTIAHLKLMQSAIEQLSTGDAHEDIRGIFVPSGDAYVCRKMSKKSSEANHTVLSEKTRLDMLKSFCEIDHALDVDDRELGTENVKVIQLILYVRYGRKIRIHRCILSLVVINWKGFPGGDHMNHWLHSFK